MNLRVWLLCLVCIAATSCDSNLTMRVGPYSKLNMTNLVIECRQLAEAGVKQDKQRWWPDADELPPQVASLSPQIVELVDQGGSTVVDIQVSGGFNHRGLLVVCQSSDPNFIPHKGRNWRIKKLAPDVFEYRE